MLISNGFIHTMKGNNIEKGYIKIQDGIIVDIGSMEFLDKVKDQDIIDADGCHILPGFIDAHCHIGMCEDGMGFEGDDVNEMTDPVTPNLRAIDGVNPFDRCFREAVESGVTTAVTGPGSANVIGGQFLAMKTHGGRIEEMVLKDPVAMKVAFGENPKNVYNEKRQTPMTRMAMAAILRENMEKAKEYMESWEEYYSNIDENDKPDIDVKLEPLVKVLKREIPLKCHAHRADDILTAIRIAKEFGLDFTIDHCTEGHLISDILKEEGVKAIVGPMLTDRSKIELRNQSLKNPGILSRAGVKVAIMTDHPCVPIQHLSLCAALAVREGMDEEEALKAITINSAEICGIENRVGSLEKGKDADIVIFKGHPFDIRSKIQYTIINGNIVFKRENSETN